jgi:N-ethylmaleimide reductase
MKLFTPLELGPIDLPNRLVMAPMTRNRAAAGGLATPLIARYYEQRAGAGLIITEASQISPQAVGYPGTPGIHTADQIEAWRKVTDRVHAAGGRITLQLWHAGRASHPSLQPEAALPVGPSPIAPAGKAFTASGMLPFMAPRALTAPEVKAIVDDFGAATGNARAAGFDGVEIHAASGYLIDQFLRDGSNRRDDRYGGSIVNRTRFLLEVMEAAVAAWSADAVGVRLSPWLDFNDMRDSDPPALFLHAVRAVSRFGLAYLHLVEPADAGDQNAPRHLAPAIRRAFQGPLMLNEGYDRHRAERAVARGDADLIAFGAAFLANPDLPERLKRGAALNTPDRKTYYGGDARGFTDYPTLAERDGAAASTATSKISAAMLCSNSAT